MSIISNTDGAAVCPGQELILIWWRVFDLPHSSSFIEKTFTERSSSGTQDTEAAFTFTVVANSNNHFESLLVTVATQLMHNTIIECHSTSLINSFTVKIESKNYTLHKSIVTDAFFSLGS